MPRHCHTLQVTSCTVATCSFSLILLYANLAPNVPAILRPIVDSRCNEAVNCSAWQPHDLADLRHRGHRCRCGICVGEMLLFRCVVPHQHTVNTSLRPPANVLQPHIVYQHHGFEGQTLSARRASESALSFLSGHHTKPIARPRIFGQPRLLCGLYPELER